MLLPRWQTFKFWCAFILAFLDIFLFFFGLGESEEEDGEEGEDEEEDVSSKSLDFIKTGPSF